MEKLSQDTLQGVILNSEALYADRIAFRFVRNEKEESVTFRDFCKDARKVCGYFLEKNIVHKNIAIVDGFDYEWLVAFFGILLSGNCAVPLNTTEPDEQILEKCKVVDAEEILCGKKSYQAFLQKNGGEKHLTKLTDVFQYGTQSSVLNREMQLPEVKTEDSAVIIYTSGTTAVAKPVVLSHKNITANLKGCYSVSDGMINAKQIEVNMTVLPPYHSYQITIGLLYQFTYGGVICISRHVKSFSKDICYYRPSGIVVVPLVIELMYNRIMLEMKRKGKVESFEKARKISRFLLKFHIDIRRKLFHEILEGLGGNLYLVHCGGADIKDEYVEFFYDIGIEIFIGYGITECSPLISVNRPKERRLGSVGKVMPAPYMELKIENQEILVRGDSVFESYYHNTQLTEESFQDGWFCTGDLGYMDKDGFLFITGRKKNLIILSNGENVSPEELEGEVLKVPGVKECLVYEKEVNNIPVIAVTIFPDKRGKEYQDQIQRELKARMKSWTTYKQIKCIEFTDTEFTKSALGKVVRQYKEGRE